MGARSLRQEIAQRAVKDKGIGIRLACDAFNISQTCYRHEAKLSTHNSEIADWLISQPNAANATIRDVRLVFRGPVATGIEQTR